MADFKTHMTVSTTVGAGLGAWAHMQADFRWSTAALAAAVCSLGGMLPDLDSDSGRPLKEMIALTSAVVPVLVVERLRGLGFDPEQIILACVCIYFLIRFGFSRVLERFTVHRGMFHSLPAMLLAGEVVFLLAYTGELRARYLFAGAVMAGFLSHLVLDEVWSLELSRLRVKKSFGTALKLWGDSGWGNLATYGLLAALSYVSLSDPNWMESIERPRWLPRYQAPAQQMADEPSETPAQRVAEEPAPQSPLAPLWQR